MCHSFLSDESDAEFTPAFIPLGEAPLCKGCFSSCQHRLYLDDCNKRPVLLPFLCKPSSCSSTLILNHDEQNNH